MCNQHKISVYVGSAKINRYDPTHSTMLRKLFTRDSMRRFNKLASAVRVAIQKKDVFGLKTKQVQVNEQLSTPTDKAYQNETTDKKIEYFMEWFDAALAQTVLETHLINFNDNGTGLWSDKYITDAYKKGVIRARSELKKKGKVYPEIETIDNVMLRSEHRDKLNVLLYLVFSEYKGIATSMQDQINRILVDSFIKKLNAKQITDRVVAVINGAGAGVAGVSDVLGRFVHSLRRSETLINTEVTKAHHLASIQEYRNAKIDRVKVKAEFATMKDDRVCSICMSLDGNIFTLNEIETIIPVHPNCRCFAMPYTAK